MNDIIEVEYMLQCDIMPVSENILEFIVTLNKIFTAFHSSMPAYVVGDINIDILQEGGVQSDFVDMMRSQSLVSLITYNNTHYGHRFQCYIIGPHLI